MKNANPVSTFQRILLLSLLWWGFGLTGCSRDAATQAVAAEVPQSIDAKFPLLIDAVTAQAQIAVTTEEMEHGLMGRKNLSADDGMIFVYPFPTQMSFWMRNTPTALDIAYIDASGKLKEIYQMYPFDERPVKSISPEIKYALEMNQGWFKSKGLKPGSQLDLSTLAKALKARGYDPDRYGVILN